MGEAKRRGSFEERKASAKPKTKKPTKAEIKSALFDDLTCFLLAQAVKRSMKNKGDI